MSGTSRPNRPRSRVKKIMAFLGKAVPVLVALATPLAALTNNVYQDYLVSPKIQCVPSETQDAFETPEDYRSVKLPLHPQMIVQCGVQVVSIIALAGYYSDNYVIFDGTTGTAQKANQDYARQLVAHVHEAVLSDVTKNYGAEAAKKIEPLLEVYISPLGSVEYQNQRGNTIKKQCIISRDNLVQDYSIQAKIIKSRLCEGDLNIEGYPASIARDEDVKAIVRGAAEVIDSQVLHPGFTQRLLIFWVKHPGSAWILFIICLVVSAFAGYVIFVQLRHCWKNLESSHSQRPVWGKVVVCTGLIILFNSLGIFAAEAVTATEDEKLIYEKPRTAEQKPVELLFSRQPSKEPEEWPGAETLERLHIPINFIGAKLSAGMLETYREVLSPAYKNGGRPLPDKPVLPAWIDVSSGAYTALDNQAFQNIEVWAENCRRYTRPANLYHLGREQANTVLLQYPHLSFESLVDIAADAVSCEELFLTYASRNIADGDVILIINAEDIALMNGKLYWTLAYCIEEGYVSSEYEKYLNCLYAAGTLVVTLGREQIGETDCEYVVLSYYMGNFEEKMLKRISKEDLSFYEKTGSDAMKHYEEALSALLKNPSHYHQEFNIEANIRSGIATLRGYGFSSSEPANPRQEAEHSPSS